MKNFITIFLLFLLTKTNAQDTAVIGTGVNYNVYPSYGPVYRFSATSTTTHVRSCLLYTAKELAQTNIRTSALIKAIAFSRGTAAVFLSPVKFRIYLINSNDTSLSNTTTWASVLAAGTKVFDDTAFNLPATLTRVHWPVTPFLYSGNGLVVATELEMPGNGGTDGKMTWEYTYTDSAVNKIIGQTGTGAAPAVLNGTDARYLYRPNIRIIYSGGTLPVELVSFTATQQENYVLLQWATAAETNTKAFEVQQSADGKAFTAITSIIAKGSAAAYNYTANNTGTDSWYRMKMIDKDGSFSYSKIVKVQGLAANHLHIYPNPAGEIVTVNHPYLKEAAKLVLTDASGKTVKVVQAAGGTAATAIALKGLGAGWYTAKLLAKGGSISAGFYKQ